MDRWCLDRREFWQLKNAEQPDIIFFMVDQLAACWLERGLTGAIVDLPNLAALAESGTSFARAISSNPLCCPARATLATGLTTAQHGVLQNGYVLDPELPTFMRALQQSGYQTGALGKVHFHPHFESLFPDYREYGFDVCHNTEDARGGPWLDWILAEHPDHADAVLSTVWARQIPEFARYGPAAVDLAARMVNIEPQPGTYELPFPAELSQTEWISRRAEEFIAAADRGRPLYAHISYVQPHGPFAPPRGFVGRVDEDVIPAPLPAEWRGDPGAPRCLAVLAEMAGERDWLADRTHYFADLLHLDEQLGRIRAAVTERGRADQTYWVFLSDHGEMLGDHGLISKGEMHYDACIRVPLIIAGPGLGGGRRRDEFVQLEDIFPTVFEMAGLPVPAPLSLRLALPFPTLPGRSLLPLCRGQRIPDWRSCAYAESYNNIDSNSIDRWARTVLTDEWRYTWYPGGGGEQMFCLNDDPGEQINRAGIRAYSEERRQLRNRLLEQIVLQSHPGSPRSRYAYGVH